MLSDAEATTMDPRALFETYKATGEPLGEGDVQVIVDAGFANPGQFEMRGGGLYWHAPSFPEGDDADGGESMADPRSARERYDDAGLALAHHIMTGGTLSASEADELIETGLVPATDLAVVLEPGDESAGRVAYEYVGPGWTAIIGADGEPDLALGG